MTAPASSWIRCALILTATLTATPVLGQGAEVDSSPLDTRESLEINDWPTALSRILRVRDHSWRQLFEARKAAARLDQHMTEQILEPLLASNQLSAEQRNFALSTLAGVQFAQGDYGAAEGTARRWVRGLAAEGNDNELADARQFLFVAKTLAGAPPQELLPSTPGSQATLADKVGLVRASVEVNAKRVDAVLDTGANLSVASRSAADRLGLVMLEGEGSIGSATMAAVGARIGIAQHLTVADADLANVPFLVLDDSALTFPVPGGYTIDAIIGFPVFKALGRISFSREGTFGWEPSGAAPATQNLFADGNDLFLEVTVAGTKATLHLDTGAAASDLTAAFARRAPATVAALGDHAVLGRSRASAGGAVVSEAVSLKQVPLSLAGQSICLPSIDVGLADDETGPTRLGSIGQDALSLFESYSIDFVSMNFEAVGAPKQVADCRSSLTEPEGGADEQAHRLEQ